MTGGTEEEEHVSLWKIVALNAHAFSYGLFYASVGVIVLPEEALKMFPQQHAIYLAVMLGIAGVSQLVSPFAGYLSDHSTNSMGRRMPFVLAGNGVLFCMVGCLYLARSMGWGLVYLFLLLIAILALNVAYTGFTGLVSDMIPADQMSVCSGIMGGCTAMGAVLGLICIGFLLPVEHAYFLYAIILAICTPLTWYAANERRHDCASSEIDWKKVRSAYLISPSSHGDFFWVFISRMFYYMAVSVQIYILYYLRDVMTEQIVVDNAKSCTAILCIVSQGSSGLVSLVAGTLADRTGRKPAIYTAVTVMALVYIGYCFVDTYSMVILLGICYGAGNGIYISVDYALAVECLPSQVSSGWTSIWCDSCLQESDGAKDLALWGVAAFLGTMFGPCVAGPLLAWLGYQPGSEHYAFIGYVGIMMCGVLYCIGCGSALLFVSKGNAPRLSRQSP